MKSKKTGLMADKPRETRDQVRWRGLMERTAAQREHVLKLYRGYLHLADDEMFRRNECGEYYCNICGSVTFIGSKRAVAGGGCCNCGTTAKNLEAMDAHISILSRAGRGVELALLQPRFSYTKRFMYNCTSCGTKMLRWPKKVESLRWSCRTCRKASDGGLQLRWYKQRLRDLYGNQVDVRDRFHQTRELKHSLRGHPEKTWMATVEQMLSGVGITEHGLMGTPPRIRKKVEYRRRFYPVVSKIMASAIPNAFAEAGKSRQLKTKFDYPIVPLIGKHIPAFFIKSEKMLIDVLPIGKFEKHRRLIKRSRAEAKKLGFTYGVILITATHSLFLKTKDWLTDIEKKLPEDITQVSFGVNRRMKLRAM